MTILAWQQGGEGPPVVLIHGWASDGPGDWAATGWVDALQASGLGALVPDLPGHGDSSDVLIPADAEPGAWTASVLEADFARMRVERTAVVGYADGCLVAAHLAVRLPDTISHVVLVGCDDRSDPQLRKEVAGALRDPQARLWSAEASEAVASARRDRRHHLPTLADWAERVAWPAGARLGALRTPVLLGVGADDTERRARVPRLARLFHDARLVTVPGDRRGALGSEELRSAAARFLNGA